MEKERSKRRALIEIKKDETEKAILVALKTRFISREVIDEHLEELKELALTAGAETVKIVVQERESYDSAYYLGKGKVEELALMVEELGVNLLIFDDDLSPVQVRNLERALNRKIVDRSGLILDIFASHARTLEAKTQVELAQLQYYLPRLTRAWTHLSKQYGGIGTKGPGETQIETDRRIIRNRISLLKGKLEEFEARRVTQTAGRKELTKVTLVGYTNVGKSTLFNLITDSDVLMEDKLFATLDSTTRVLQLGKNRSILLSDTVGFIRKLPHNLVASFRSTLGEVRDADIIIHLADISHDFYEDHIRVVEETLRELGCDGTQIMLVFNKVDILHDKGRIEYIKAKYPGSVIISAGRGINISIFNQRLSELVYKDYTTEKLTFSAADSKTIAALHTIAEVLSTNYDDDKVVVEIMIHKKNLEKLKGMVAGYNFS
ncbi:MAG: GTPase HflX [Ignavibacteriaceae bacterium]|nr:GTPase HflX [Ignavibacteriaceae bacterium]